MTEKSRSAGMAPLKDQKVKRSITLTKAIKRHAGGSASGSRSYGSGSYNNTVEGAVSVTVEEAAPGSMSPEELYDDADAILSAAINMQLAENDDVLDVLTAQSTSTQPAR